MSMGFPGSSAGKESACNARDSSSIPGSGRSVGEGLGYPPVLLGFPDSSASKEYTCNVRDLGLIPSWEDPLEKEMATHSTVLAWRTSWTEEPANPVHGVTKSWA